MKIKRNTKYRVKGESKYFANKYGTSNPEIIIEDTDEKVFGGSWKWQTGNPACMIFAMRSVMDNVDAITETVYYGKVGSMGELVCESELEKIK